MACSTLFVGVFALGAASALGGTCTAGADVQCPGSGNICAGDQCCPGYAGSGGGTFPCPSASIGFLGCVNNTKITNCVPGSLRGSLAQNKLQMQDTCTAYSQCGGQNWHGCTECPGQQVCQLKGTDPWTKVCVGQLAELSSAAEVVNTTTAGFTTGGLAETQDLPCGSDNSDDCVTEFHHGLGPFCFRCSHEGGSNPLRNRCHLCCTEC
jgi:hypothetical protein